MYTHCCDKYIPFVCFYTITSHQLFCLMKILNISPGTKHSDLQLHLLLSKYGQQRNFRNTFFFCLNASSPESFLSRALHTCVNASSPKSFLSRSLHLHHKSSWNYGISNLKLWMLQITSSCHLCIHTEHSWHKGTPRYGTSTWCWSTNIEVERRHKCFDWNILHIPARAHRCVHLLKRR